MLLNHYSIVLAIISSFAFALPIELTPEQQAADISVLNYALTLEHLEAAYYNEGLANFTRDMFSESGYPDYIYTLFEQIRDHENTHVSTLESVITSLNATAVPVCNYTFNISDIATFIDVSRALENTGVSAYAGSAKNLSNPDLLTAAATILSTEARHAAFLQYIGNKSPFPNAFDVPLDESEVLSIASQFIVACPFSLPKSFPKLTLGSTQGVPQSIVDLEFSGSSGSSENALNCVFLGGESKLFSPINDGGCVVPQNVTGLSYIVVSNASDVSQLNDETIIAGPAAFEVPVVY